MITVFLSENSFKVDSGTTAIVFFNEKLQKSELKRLLLVRINGIVKDISTILNDNDVLEPIFEGDEGTLEILRHTTAHIMAHAVFELFPGVQFTIGPAIENGFYYDFDYKRPFTQEDLLKIEEKMTEIINKKIPIIREELSIFDAKNKFEHIDAIYKLELLKELEEYGEKIISVYTEDNFFDLCRGPHLQDTGKVRAFKLLSVAGAYWRGDENKQMLQRIYGTAFFDKKDLKDYLDKLEEAKKRDHRKLGKELKLFSIEEEIGPGLILWHPKGAMLRKSIEDFWKSEHINRGYSLLYTPHIAKRDLWNTSGHLSFYADNMYSPMYIDEVTYQIKPMNCPFHIAIYNTELKSYRDFPLRWCELGTVYRYERTGTLHGLMRVRGFTQDDAHIFCRLDQIEDEINNILEMTLFFLRVFGFERYDIYLSTRPEKYVGTDDNWEKATNALKNALNKQGLPYQIDPGEGVFYGPKIDIKIKDCLDRSWQCSTIQVDFNLPERFKVSFINSEGNHEMPIMIHRAIMGSLERFIGVLIEHYAGSFPLWLSPVQARIVTVSEKHNEWAEKLLELLKTKKIRVEADLRNEKLGKKIREAQLEKIPFMLVIGDKEVEEKKFSPRTRKGDTLAAMTAEEFLSHFGDSFFNPDKS